MVTLKMVVIDALVVGFLAWGAAQLLRYKRHEVKNK